MARLTWYLGAWIRHSRWYPDWQRRIYRRDKASFSGAIHSALRYDGQVGRLHGNLLHYTIRTFPEHEAKLEKYTTTIAQEMFEQGKRHWRAAMWFATPWSWIHHFFLGAGFLDGYRGALIAQMAARGVRLKFKSSENWSKPNSSVRNRWCRVIPLIVDLETEWRGGQNQALLLLKGLYERGHAAELVATHGSSLGHRAKKAGIYVHSVSRRMLRRLSAAAKIRSVLADGRIRTCSRQ